LIRSLNDADQKEAVVYFTTFEVGRNYYNLRFAFLKDSSLRITARLYLGDDGYSLTIPAGSQLTESEIARQFLTGLVAKTGIKDGPLLNILKLSFKIES